MTKSELLALVEAYAHRNDFAALYDQFLQLVEARIAERLRASDTVIFATIDTSVVAPVFGQSYALPDDFLTIKDVSVNGSGGRQGIVRAVGTDEITRASRQSGGGAPSVYNIQDNQITLRPGPGDRVINLTYYGRLAALVGDDDTNGILDKYPAIYLYGVLIEVWDWAQNNDEREKSIARFSEEIGAVNLLSWQQEFGTAPVGNSGYNYSAQGSRL